MNILQCLVVSFPFDEQVPKYLLKSQNFQQECIISAVELLSAHFAQWSYHITFPELSVIPLIRLKRFYSKTTVESHRHIVKRLIEQVRALHGV